MSTPRMTPGYSLDGQPAALERPILEDGLFAILRTGRRITTIGTQQWRDKQLIDLYQQ